MTDNILEAFEGTRNAGAIASAALDEVVKIIKPGIKTSDIDKLCYEFINDNNAYSAPLFYRGYPKSCCTSTNHIVCHGIPQNKYLKEGDIVNVDVTVNKNGWHGDTSRMYFVGEVSIKAKKLVKTTYDAMYKSIKILKDLNATPKIFLVGLDRQEKGNSDLSAKTELEKDFGIYVSSIINLEALIKYSHNNFSSIVIAFIPALFLRIGRISSATSSMFSRMVECRNLRLSNFSDGTTGNSVGLSPRTSSTIWVGPL